VDKPNSVDPIAWARYNEFLSGARRSVRPSKEYADVKQEVEGTDAHRSRCNVESTFDRSRDKGSVPGVVASELGDDRECSRRFAA